ncbi:MAG: glycosyltransferase family 39 protein, partial [Bifidobacteriaceae bacterium]|nr:glycosyltransferase family 39 protein [Bifidobacteriaceae bacterium]
MADRPASEIEPLLPSAGKLPWWRQPWVLKWAPPLAITFMAGLMRFWNLGRIHKLIFDETYYVKDAYSLLVRGVEMSWTKDTNPTFEAGDFSELQDTSEYVVHPPVGKWMIAFGMKLFGPESSFGWRFSAALCGTVAVFLIILIGWRLFGSRTLGCVAGVLLAVDGQALILSRVSLLDGFLMFWVLVALWLILKDREQMDQRLEARVRRPYGHGPWGEPLYRNQGFGPGLGMRWYLLGAGVALGLACGVKWSGLYFLAVFGLLVVCWDALARRRVGLKSWLAAAVVRDGFKAFALLVPVALVTYILSWTGWFLSDSGHKRHWAEEHPGEGLTFLPKALRSLVEYHHEAFNFHTTLTSPHDYQSTPYGWLLQLRTTSMFYESEPTCGAETCSQAITDFGNPIIWWLALVGLLVVIYGAFIWADKRAWVILCGYIGGYVPWLFFAERTIFTFYTVAFVPFVVLALVYTMGMAIGPPLRAGGRPRAWAITTAGLVVFVAVLVAAFFWPVWTGLSIPYQ